MNKHLGVEDVLSIPILLMQAASEKPEFWIALFFVTGLVAMIISAMICGAIWSHLKKKTLAEADRAGVDIHLSETEGIDIDIFEIEGCGYCIVFIIILILGALGISFPIVLSEEVETMILVLVLIIFGAATWAVTLWSPYYLRSERRRFRRILDEALRNKND